MNAAIKHGGAGFAGALAIFLMMAAATEVEAARSRTSSDDPLRRAGDLLEAGEAERGVRMLQTLVDRNPGSLVSLRARLQLGRHYHQARDNRKAIEHLRRLEMLKTPGKKLEGERRDIYVEALYLVGVSHFNAREYGKAFAALQRVVREYRDTVWANQAFYYIGMSHFARERWREAIRALSMVGTLVKPGRVPIEVAEARHRLHIKIEDADLAVLKKMGHEIRVTLETASGDTETIPVAPLAGSDEVFMGSLVTAAGSANPGNGTIEITGGDKVTVTYVDRNTEDGTRDVVRKKEIKIVSSGSIDFTLGTHEGQAVAAFVGQPLYLRARDLDMDVSDGRDMMKIRLASTCKIEEPKDNYEAPTLAVDLDSLLEEDQKPRLRVRDEMVVTLIEVGEGDKVHSGVFVGTVQTTRAGQGSVDTADGIMECAVGDELIASYVDELHSAQAGPIEVAARLMVAGGVGTDISYVHSVVPDAVLRARKEVVEARAYLELARIFNGMGLRNRANAKAETGLEKVQFTVESEDAPIPLSTREEAYRIMWELYLEQGELSKAMAVCDVFSRNFPRSPLVGNALIGIAKVLENEGKLDEAVAVLRRILGMPSSLAQAEAQWLVARILEAKGAGRATISEAAVKEYRACATKYPGSEFAGRSLGKIVEYHIQTKDYSSADRMLEQIFLDYRDEPFLASMLLKWAIISYRTGDRRKAIDKCRQVVFEFPSTPEAKKALELIERLRAQEGDGNTCRSRPSAALS